MSIPAGVDLSQIPGMPPPPGKTPNFADPAADGTLRPETLAVGVILGTLTILFGCLRLYTRVHIMKNPGWDDIWLIVAVICSTTFTVLQITTAYLVGAVHMWNIPVDKLMYYTPLLRSTGMIYSAPTLLTAKVALGSFFLRIFGAKPCLRLAIWCAIIWSIFNSLLKLFWMIGACPHTGQAYMACADKVTKPVNVASAMNVASDTSLLILPIWGVFSLQMQKKRKIALSLVFLTGASALLASCLGLYYRLSAGDSPDLTWSYAPADILALFEVNNTIIVACLPALPCLVQKMGIFTKASSGIKSIKQTWITANKSVAGSIGSRFSRKSSQSTESSDSKQKIFVHSEIVQMEEGKRESDDHALVVPFAQRQDS